MSASYPTSVKSFTTKSDGVDLVQAAHINDLQDEVNAVEQGLVNGVQHDLKPLTDNAKDLGTASLQFRNLYVGTDANIGGDATIDGDATIGGAVTLSAQPRAQVFRSTVQSIPNSAWTAITFDSEDHDVGSVHDTGLNTSRLTAPSAGIYLVGATVNFVENATGSRACRLKKNGSTLVSTAGSIGGDAPGTAIGNAMSTMALLSLAAADYIEVEAFQDSGGALNSGHASNRHQQNQAFLIRLA